MLNLKSLCGNLKQKDLQLDEKKIVILLGFAIFSAEFLIPAAMKISYLNIFSISFLHFFNNLGIFVLVVSPLLILMPGLADSKKRLRRINSLLKAIRDINRNTSRELDVDNILAETYRKLKEVNGYFHVTIINYNGQVDRLAGDEIAVGNSIRFLKCIEKTIKSNKPELFTTDRGRFSKANTVAIPSVIKDSFLLVISSSISYDEEEINLLEGLAKDIGHSIARCEYENNRVKAIEQLANNLTQFDKSADRLRNLLAVIKSYLELRDELGNDNTLQMIEEQTDKIEENLNELRNEELTTYQLTKNFETLNYRE